MRALSARQAATCETAKSRRCRCRCGGLLHGAGRFTADDGRRDELDEADAHAATRPDKPERDELVGLVQAELFDTEGRPLP